MVLSGINTAVDKTKKKVFVGVSGGVDSSVSLALLKEAGYDVTGVFIKVWSPDFLPCTWKEERRDAMRVCATLDVPFLTLDLEKEYKDSVVDYMIAEYMVGRTPNPDVMCNKYVKFGAFFKKAMEMGADYVATGHYAMVKNIGSAYKLFESVDKNKDQSYFLWTLTQKELSKTLFPVGGMQKDEVRKLAKKFGLPTADKKDSQGLCFVGKVDMVDFLKHYITNEKGNVLDEKGNTIGTHDGAMFYTIGQRHGFDVRQDKSDNKPVYVISKNIKENTITVGDGDYKKISATTKEVELEQVSFTADVLDNTKNLLARTRYRQILVKCSLIKNKDIYTIIFDEPQENVTPGQSLVLYREEECLGGGVIKS